MTYPKPSVTVDCVIFRFNEYDGSLLHHGSRGEGRASMQVLLIERGGPPFVGRWAIPGGFVNIDESLDDAAYRELHEETGLKKGVYMEQLYTFGRPKRDPRGRVIAVAYMALMRPDVPEVKAGSDARTAEWCDIALARSRRLAFDHHDILHTAVNRLEAKVHYAPVLFDLVPEKFTMAELQRVYETIVHSEVDARHFRRKVEKLGVLEVVGTKETGHRPATLYKFDRNRYEPDDFHL